MEKIFADFNNVDAGGRIRLNTRGALTDIQEKQIELIEGKLVWLSDNEELHTVGVLRYSHAEKIWVAEIDWKGLGM